MIIHAERTGSSQSSVTVGRMKLSRYLVVLPALALLGACSAGAPAPSGEVASLSTPNSAAGTAAASSPADADSGRPRERLDMTSDDLDALSAPYLTCLKENGSPKGNPHSTMTNLPQAEAKAEAACTGKQPLPPWELDSSNPHAADFAHAVVQCLRAKGVRYVEEQPPAGGRVMIAFGGPDNDSESISKGMQFAPACEKEVAAQGIGK